MVDSMRAKDAEQERKVIAFLDKYLYSKVSEHYELVDNREDQIRGVDIRAFRGQKVICHDVKAQASPHYINNPTPTFCMELLFDKDGHTYEGWFVRENMLTDFYVFGWIHKAKQNKEGYFDSPEDIEKIEIYFVDKKKLKEFVAEEFSDAELLQIAYEMRENNEIKRPHNNDMHFYYTHPNILAEHPVNLIIWKRVLKRFSPKRYIVQKDGLWELTDNDKKILIS